MAARLEEFSQISQIKIWIGSYNVGDSIATEPLDGWLVDARNADLVICGFQEVDMRAQNLLSGRISVTREGAWAAAITKALAELPGESFQKVCLAIVRILALIVVSAGFSVSRVSSCTCLCPTQPGGHF